MLIRIEKSVRAAPWAALCMMSVALLWAPAPAGAQSTAQSGGAGHEIRIVATIPPTCQLGQLNGQRRAVLAGRTDSGEAVHIEFQPSTGFNVECNTAYALSLQRIGMPAPSRPRAAALRDTQTPAAEAMSAPDGFDVLVRLADRKVAPGGLVSLEQRCMFGVRDALDEHCAIQADGLPLLPARRSVARLTLMPRSAAETTLSDAETIDEMAMLGLEPPRAGDVSPIATGSVGSRPRAAKPRVIQEHLMLSVTGRF